MDIGDFNKKYLPLSPEERIKEVYNDFAKILFTSSFGTTAVYMLHLFYKIKPGETVYFLNTSYHFSETLSYKKLLTEKFNLTVVNLKGDDLHNTFTSQDETWKKDPNLCCSINKVEPLNKIKFRFDVWVSGLMKSQNAHRNKLNIFEQQGDIIKFYPIIDVTEDQVNKYILTNKLPEHPLKSKGFASVGCSHCTIAGMARAGRWVDMSKTECGLHL